MPEVEQRMIDLKIQMDLQTPGVMRERIIPDRLAIAANPDIQPYVNSYTISIKT